LLGRRRVVRNRVERGMEGGGALACDLPEQVGLRLDVVVERALLHAHRGRDVADRGSVVALLGEEARGEASQLVATRHPARTLTPRREGYGCRMTGHASGAAIFAEAAARARQRPARGMDREWVGVLARVPLFEQMSRRQLRRLAGLATARRFAAGSPIFHAGDHGDAFYVVLDGAVRARPPAAQPVTLKAGDFFGEMALLDGA